MHKNSAVQKFLLCRDKTLPPEEAYHRRQKLGAHVSEICFVCNLSELDSDSLYAFLLRAVLNVRATVFRAEFSTRKNYKDLCWQMERSEFMRLYEAQIIGLPEMHIGGDSHALVIPLYHSIVTDKVDFLRRLRRPPFGAISVCSVCD